MPGVHGTKKLRISAFDIKKNLDQNNWLINRLIFVTCAKFSSRELNSDQFSANFTWKTYYIPTISSVKLKRN